MKMGKLQEKKFWLKCFNTLKKFLKKLLNFQNKKSNSRF